MRPRRPSNANWFYASLACCGGCGARRQLRAGCSKFRKNSCQNPCAQPKASLPGSAGSRRYSADRSATSPTMRTKLARPPMLGVTWRDGSCDSPISTMACSNGSAAMRRASGAKCDKRCLHWKDCDGEHRELALGDRSGRWCPKRIGEVALPRTPAKSTAPDLVDRLGNDDLEYLARLIARGRLNGWRAWCKGIHVDSETTRNWKTECNQWCVWEIRRRSSYEDQTLRL